MDEGDRRGIDRLTIQEAARTLGISEGAVRKRVTRRTLKHEKEQDGRVYVYLDAGDRRGVDSGQDEGVDPNSNALISQFREEVAYLRDENRRKDEIIMQQAMTMRQLAAASSQEPSESRESAESAEEERERTEPRSAAGGAQKGAESRSGSRGTQRPHRRLSSSDGLPLWQLVLGVCVVAVAWGGGMLLGYYAIITMDEFLLLTRITPTLTNAASLCLLGAFGYWVGYRTANVDTWRFLIPIGTVIGIIAGIIVIVGFPAMDAHFYPDPQQPTTYTDSFVLTMGAFGLVGAIGFFYFPATFGHGRRRQALAAYPELRTDVKAASEANSSTASSSRTEAPSEPWSPRKQTMIGLYGTILSAVATILLAAATIIAGYLPGR